MEFTRTILDALKHWVNGRFSNIEKALEGKQPSGDYALKSEIPSLEGIATEEYVDNALAEFVPGEGGASVQSDWNQNDETASDYVKNRTHYIADEVLIDKQVTLSYGNQDRECYCTHGATLNFEVGATYRIYFDKTIVETVAHNTTYLVVIDGNMTISVSDYYLSVDYPTSRTALFRLEKVNGYCHQLDEKFIPDTIARTDDINEQINDIIESIPDDEQIASAVAEYMAEHPVSGGNVDVSIDGETLVISENSTATIENETLIL